MRPINRFNLDHRFEADATTLRFEGVTTGGFQAMDARLSNQDGTLTIATGLVQVQVPLRDLLAGEAVWEAGGFGRRMRAFLLPDDAPRAMVFERQVSLRADADNALYLRATFEDGSVLWTSPVYLLR